MILSKKIIDLTHPLHDKIPTWTGGCGFSYQNKIDYDQGLRAQSLRMHAGIGTHMDAPTHFVKGGKSISDIDLHDLILPMHILDASNLVDQGFALSIADIKAYEEKYGKIIKGSFFALYTGWEKHWETPEKYRNLDENGIMHFPHYSPDAGAYLLEKGIKGLGIDTLSPDPEVALSKTPFPVHHMILGEGGYIVENLANLSKVGPHASAILLPLAFKDGTESPMRAVAMV